MASLVSEPTDSRASAAGAGRWLLHFDTWQCYERSRTSLFVRTTSELQVGADTRLFVQDGRRDTDGVYVLVPAIVMGLRVLAPRKDIPCSRYAHTARRTGLRCPPPADRTRRSRLLSAEEQIGEVAAAIRIETADFAIDHRIARLHGLDNRCLKRWPALHTRPFRDTSSQRPSRKCTSARTHGNGRSAAAFLPTRMADRSPTLSIRGGAASPFRSSAWCLSSFGAGLVLAWWAYRRRERATLSLRHQAKLRHYAPSDGCCGACLFV